MAFPMIAFKRWAEFRKTLIEEHGVEVSGEPGHYLLSKGGRIMAVPVLLDDDEHMTPSVMRDICYHLGLDLKAFGLAIE